MQKSLTALNWKRSEPIYLTENSIFDASAIVDNIKNPVKAPKAVYTCYGHVVFLKKFLDKSKNRYQQTTSNRKVIETRKEKFF